MPYGSLEGRLKFPTNVGFDMQATYHEGEDDAWKAH